ncbi:hypothetical protein NA57DRAFT_63447 [Rhizodiscina lignyota]|uniref:Uncharacterized protein n=1 Tax=Rhizodiscina lignyota TaxID=1504668 RepID=A0A9P4M9V2_9PEZI|nr:hypothetical protein NA57DRAFT_63447 [Rhizodiscina lignyota]
MVTSGHPPANGFVAAARRVYNPLGFAKGYNFILWFIFDLAFVGFVLARLINGGNSAAPGECYYYEEGHYKIGMMLHLSQYFPQAFLPSFSSCPAIRHNCILVHRICGYLAIILVLIGIAGALMVARIAFGGGLAIQTFVGFLVIMASIITTRIIMIIAALVISSVGDYYTARACAQITYIYHGNQEKVTRLYPDCAAFFNGSSLSQNVVVNENMNCQREQVGAALGEGFGAAVWLAFALHAIGVEIYLQMTPAESQRLRKVSYQRQLEAGFLHPGSAGLTSDRWGDAPPYEPDATDREAP